MALTAGSRLRGQADTTEVVVVRAPEGDIDLRCGGHPMIALGSEANGSLTVEDGFAEGTKLGKRYVDDSGLELLCTKPGEGSLSVGDVVLGLKEAKPLPSSD
jgi:hypothetical protein